MWCIVLTDIALDRGARSLKHPPNILHVTTKFNKQQIKRMKYQENLEYKSKESDVASWFSSPSVDVCKLNTPHNLTFFLPQWNPITLLADDVCTYMQLHTQVLMGKPPYKMLGLYYSLPTSTSTCYILYFIYHY